MTTKKPKPWRDQRPILFELAIGIPIVLCVAGMWWWLGHLPQRATTDQATAGQYGDMFGAVNSLFSALAFTAIIWTIVGQRREIAMQKEELRLQRRELRLQRKQLKLQREEMEKSRREFTRQADIAANSTLLAMFTKLTDQYFAATKADLPLGAYKYLRDKFVIFGRQMIATANAIQPINVGIVAEPKDYDDLIDQIDDLMTECDIFLKKPPVSAMLAQNEIRRLASVCDFLVGQLDDGFKNKARVITDAATQLTDGMDEDDVVFGNEHDTRKFIEQIMEVTNDLRGFIRVKEFDKIFQS